MGPHLGAFWVPFGPLGLLLGHLGRVLGVSWGGLGTSWSGLGASWDGLGSYVAASCFLNKIKMDFKWILRSKRLPKRSQNGAPNGTKSKQNSKIKKTALWDRVWVVLGSFWCRSGGHKSLKFVGFYSVS